MGWSCVPQHACRGGFLLTEYGMGKVEGWSQDTVFLGVEQTEQTLCTRGSVIVRRSGTFKQAQ
jgi:hypothetical protein